MRSNCEVDFLRYYWERLKLEGVCGYSFETLWDHYRRSVVCDLARLVFIGGSNAGKSEVMVSLLEHGIRGRTGSAKQLDLHSFIEAT
jgi:GTP-binding protein EngB required for normal cell division